jgi:hypothetical protein
MSRNLSVIVLGFRDERVLETLESMEGDLRFKVKVYGYDSELPALDLDLEKRAGGLEEALKECDTRYITFLKPGDIVDNLYIPEDDEERPIILGTLDGEYETGSTHSLASLLFETKTLPRDLRGIMFNLEKVKILGDTEPERLVSVFNTLDDLGSESYYRSWGKYEDKTFQITSSDIIENNEPEVIEECKRAWTKVDFDTNIRELLWNRMARTAAGILEYKPEAIDEYLVYLRRENKLKILN